MYLHVDVLWYLSVWLLWSMQTCGATLAGYTDTCTNVTSLRQTFKTLEIINLG